MIDKYTVARKATTDITLSNGLGQTRSVGSVAEEPRIGIETGFIPDRQGHE